MVIDGESDDAADDLDASPGLRPPTIPADPDLVIDLRDDAPSVLESPPIVREVTSASPDEPRSSRWGGHRSAVTSPAAMRRRRLASDN